MRRGADNLAISAHLAEAYGANDPYPGPLTNILDGLDGVASIAPAPGESWSGSWCDSDTR